MTRTLIFTEGFEKGNYAAPQPKWTSESFSGTGTGRFGSDDAWYLQSSGDSPVLSLGIDTQGLHFGFGFKKVAISVNGFVIRFQDGATDHLRIYVSASGELVLTRLTTTVATSVETLSSNVWAHIEGRIWIADDPDGRAIIKVNGDTWIDFTGDTRNGVDASVDRINLNNNSNNSQIWFDDFYLYTITDFDNDEWVGDARIFTLTPNGAGNYTQWTPNTGTNYTNVDEDISDDDTTYNYTTGTSYIDTFTFSNIVGDGVVLAVNSQFIARKDDAGERTLGYVYRRGDDYFASGSSLGDTYDFFNSIMETDPLITGAWTIANVNNAEFGYRLDS